MYAQVWFYSLLLLFAEGGEMCFCWSFPSDGKMRFMWEWDDREQSTEREAGPEVPGVLRRREIRAEMRREHMPPVQQVRVADIECVGEVQHPPQCTWAEWCGEHDIAEPEWAEVLMRAAYMDIVDRTEGRLLDAQVLAWVLEEQQYKFVQILRVFIPVSYTHLRAHET